MWTILNPQTMVKVIRNKETSEATFRDLKEALSAAVDVEQIAAAGQQHLVSRQEAMCSFPSASMFPA